jgi:thimet oligopeptidase
MKILFCAIVFGSTVFFVACTALGQQTLIRSDYGRKEIADLCQRAIAKANQRFNAVGSVPSASRTLENTLLALENANADLSEEITPLLFMKQVSTDPAVRAEAGACEQAISDFGVEISSRRDLYNAVKEAKGRDPFEKRLAMRTIQGFERNGLKLSDTDLQKVKTLNQRLGKLQNDFSTNLINDKTTLTFSESELEGARPDYLSRLKHSQNGLTVGVSEVDFNEILKYVKNSESRKRFLFAFLNRAADANTALLEEAVQIRQKLARLLGFKTWADFQIEPRMAKSSKTVFDFLNGLKTKLAKRNRKDFDQLLAFKKELDPQASTLNQWDQTYFDYQLSKRDYKIDDELVREYFPADVVISSLFDVYAKMLSLQFVEVKGAKVWAEGVKQYEIRNQKDGRLIGYFYTDFFPREGKYAHAAAFSLIQGRMVNGKYNLPVSAIVANLAPPSNGKPSLLPHNDVETIFHEFGHIMHQTLTRAPFASLSGSSVSMDFVEAPSQMLENWVWDPKILSELSGHYLDHSKKLPADLLAQMIKTRDFQQGRFYTRQLLYSLFDMNIHSKTGAVDVTKTYADLYRSIIGEEPLLGTHMPASFGHVMGGYDAGYYGYLWSKVYAQDMFTIFQKDGLTSPEVGMSYRENILEKGDTVDAIDLLRQFLHREPNSNAFFKFLNL